MTSARRLREVSPSSKARSAATVDRRSSQKAMGSGVSRSRLRAKARVDCARGPSLPSMLKGRPSTMPTSARSVVIFSRACASSVNFSRRITRSGEATERRPSLTATPMVLVPRSSPARPPVRGRAAAKSSIAVQIIAGPPFSLRPRPRPAPRVLRQSACAPRPECRGHGRPAPLPPARQSAAPIPQACRLGSPDVPPTP